VESPTPYQTLLPYQRSATRESVPFTITRVDFTRAMYVHRIEGLFMCTTTQAIHLTDLNMETFLLAFKRFASRRSQSQILISDNASTYTAAADELTQLLQSNHLTDALGKQGFQWNFIPKCAPWYGSWWECLIERTEMALKKVLGRSRVTLTVLQILIVEVEAILTPDVCL